MPERPMRSVVVPNAAVTGRFSMNAMMTSWLSLDSYEYFTFYGVGASGAEVRVELEEAADDALGNVFLAFGGFGTADDELYEALGVGEGTEGCEYAP